MIGEIRYGNLQTGGNPCYHLAFCQADIFDAGVRIPARATYSEEGDVRVGDDPEPGQVKALPIAPRHVTQDQDLLRDF